MSQPHPTPAASRSASLGWIVLVYAIACGIAWLVMAASPAGSVRGLVAGLFASVAVTYVASLLLKNGSVFDPWWSVLPPVVALQLVTQWTPLTVACVLVIFVWAVRLTLNWVVGWPGLGHEDWRYTRMYAQTPVPRWLTLLVGVQLVPAVFVTLGCLPLIPALTHGGALGPIGLAATALGLFAAGLELAADEQRRAHAAARPGALMDVGLWSWFRHPNYLGEILFWVSLWGFGLAAAPATAWWTALGPIAMAGLFALASIPMMETRNAERRPGWAEYVARTPRLIPRPPRR
jgi:steroid 5-alpha reductase family enzyme